MCLGVPARVIEVKEASATVEVGGARREISVMLLDRVAAGDWVILHAGFAIEKLSPEEAEKTLELFKELSDAAEIH
ncbi:MAG: HypC/HybG/HupF family hydrogenase formation chaperone [Deltaproteobacteria bacterium]|nr:HypC/HybG/HupF family hydrogenase formation chaperone [Deltaproteobacteria bacterium]PWB61905.1 MAG: HypC/HybG/HupF family hydrogenase formation chaperone [Deltaproteobacteria bacterium]